MTTITAPVSEALPAEGDHRSSDRAAAVGGLLFVVIVIGQNVIRGITAPDAGANASAIIADYADHRAWSRGLIAAFAVSGLGIALFIGGVWVRIARGRARAWAQVFFLGAAGIVALFSTMIGIETALLVATDHPTPTPAVVEGLWVLHNGVFGVLQLSIAIAVLGLSLAAVDAGLAHRAFRWVGPAAAGLLLVGVVAAPDVAAGGAAPAMGLAGIGFLGWLAVVTNTSVSLLRK
jgi:hypothetical protein